MLQTVNHMQGRELFVKEKFDVISVLSQSSRRPRCDSNNDDEKNYTEDSNCDQYSCA